MATQGSSIVGGANSRYSTSVFLMADAVHNPGVASVDMTYSAGCRDTVLDSSISISMVTAGGYCC